ncbi:hypothetical protein GQ53DRAFT_825885 [Thozetella sp. PMI_491]|nr:hypothetical protein GQ53DRAFT_825885 [Thozetella sp. PMI_491]
MILRRNRCLTCKSRRVKCDSARPRCTTCRKACRTCTWEPDAGTGVLFRNEEAFARGLPRRPRAAYAQKPAQEAELVHFLRPAIAVPMRVQAFNYFAEHFLDWPFDMPDIGRDYMAHVLDHWHRADENSCLRLALSALSLAFFGRGRGAPAALEDADKCYSAGIGKAQNELRGLSADTLDNLIVATLLMTTYENVAFKEDRLVDGKRRPGTDQVGSRFWKDICHWEGTSALLQIRQEKGLSHNLPMYRVVRRPIIRAHILRGTPVPKALQDGAEFGEEGPSLALDMLTVRIAQIRARTLSPAEVTDSAGTTQAAAQLLVDAINLEADLAAWPLDLPEEWRYSVRSINDFPGSSHPSMLYDGSFYTFPTHGHAAVWLRYQAKHLIVITIIIRMLATAADSTSRRPCTADWLGHYTEKLGAVATDMCRSVPFFFGAHGDGAISPLEVQHVSPRIATLLGWPLAVALSIEIVPAPQKRWLQSRLQTVASVQGNAMLQSIAEKEAFKF